jgi:phenylacetic acid degradation operon negative regulatory protein
VAADWCRWWRGAVPERDTDVTELWDLDGWARGAGALLDQMAQLRPALEAGDHQPLAAGFVPSAAVLRHLQADPLLPAELLPAGWPGDELRQAYDRYDAAYRAVLRDWLAG